MLRYADTKYGTAESVASNGGFALFRGIPYAKPPAGELRWCPPQPPEAWEGIRKCDTFGPICPQKERPMLDETGHPIVLIPNYPYPPEIDEDCLYLNVYTPAESAEDKLPVMVYIHGGGVQEHYGHDYEYCGDGFCRHGVVLVNINYRLNVFGYYVHPELASESGHAASGNYGTMDQIQAIRWVRENIAAFGGDPDNMTIFGQSGGGRSVQAICCSPLTKGLFRHASIHSAGGGYTPFGLVSRDEMEKRGLEFMREAGCSSISEMRALPWPALNEKFLKYSKRVGFQGGFNIYSDGWVLPAAMEDCVLAGGNHDVDYIAGCTVDEGLNGIPKMFGFNLCASLRSWGRRQYENGKKPLYMYCFDRPQPGDDIGTPHSCDVRYLFGTIDGTWRPYDESDYRLSETMLAYWSNFAKTGDPNGPGLQRWEPFTEDRLQMRLGADACEMRDFDADGSLAKIEDEFIKRI